MLDGSHRNWDSDNLFSTALVKLLTKLDVFFGSWELVNGCALGGCGAVGQVGSVVALTTRAACHA